MRYEFNSCILFKRGKILTKDITGNEFICLIGNFPEEAILHSHRHENLKSYIALTGWTL
jgi:hypothetical protein